MYEMLEKLTPPKVWPLDEGFVQPELGAQGVALVVGVEESEVVEDAVLGIEDREPHNERILKRGFNADSAIILRARL
jgi:hypothetical protein